jgi:hypothetical protein
MRLGRRSSATLLALATLAGSLAWLSGGTPASATGTVSITAAYYDPYPGPDPNTNAARNHEYIVIRNNGSKAIALTGYVLHDVPRAGSTNRFVFPRFTLRPGKSVRVHTGSGTNTATDLYWRRTFYVWGDDADTATLQRKSGGTASQCSWTATSSSPKFC